MKIIKKILPGTNGSKRYTQEYGDKLVCVRYRKDAERNKRITTVEIIVDEAQMSTITTAARQLHPHYLQKVFVKIDYNEQKLRDIIKLSGGKWDIERKLWIVSYKTASDLQVTNRIVWLDMDMPRNGDD